MQGKKPWCFHEHPFPTSHSSLQEASVFFKKRAMLEEEFGRGMQKLAKNTADIYAMNDGKAGCVNTILSLLGPSSPNSAISIHVALSSTHGRRP
jgi:Fes/CIP4, and EFC/F-BAR homology domain